MELQQLKYFQTMARLQHYTQAARALYISQSSLSRSIARLEAELGAPLFDQQGRNVKLNNFGQTFLRRVEAALKELEEGQREIKDQLGPESGVVTLAFLPSVGVSLMPRLLSLFKAQYPAVNFQLFQNSVTVMLNKLEAGEVDLCIASPFSCRSEIKWATLLTEELFLAVPPNHRLALRSSVRLSEVADESFISMKPGYGMRDIADNLCQQAGFKPNITFEGEEISTVRGLVGAGLGVALVPALEWANSIGRYGKNGDNLEPIRLSVEAPICQRDLSLAWVEKRFMPASTHLFRQFLLAYFKKLA